MAKILVVDDEAEMRKFMEVVLSSAGHQIVVAVDGEDGLAKATGEMPDLVLMDVNMPKMTGYEATRKLKANPATKDLPVLAVTAHNRPADLEEAHEAGCEGTVAKPLDPVRLLSRVKEVLGG